DAEATEMTTGQELLEPVLAAAQQLFQVGGPRPGRLWARTPWSLRTRAPRASALIFPRHRSSPPRGLAAFARPRNTGRLGRLIRDGHLPYNAGSQACRR